VFVLAYRHRTAVSATRLRKLYLPLVVLFAYNILYDILDSIFEVAERSPLVDMVFGESTVILLTCVIVLAFLNRNYLHRKPVDGTVRQSVMEHYGITMRESQVIELVAGGSTAREIADELHLSRQTVKNYIHRAYRKMGVSNKVEMINTIRP
jgi:DNA-binding CsgD family transcriptional regulator